MKWLLYTDRIEGLYEEKFPTHSSFKWKEIEDDFNIEDWSLENGELVLRNKELEHDIQVGNRILTEVFRGNPHSQTALIRKSLQAMLILINPNSSNEEKQWADDIIQHGLSLSGQIENILEEEYAEEE